MKDKKRKARDHCHYAREYRGAAHSIFNLKYSISERIPVVFHNRSNYDYDFIIKELAEEFKKQFTCLGENTDKIQFLQFIDSPRFMASSLSNLVNNLSEGIHKIKCKYGHDKKCETCGIKYKYYDCFLNIKILKMI